MAQVGGIILAGDSDADVVPGVVLAGSSEEHEDAVPPHPLHRRRAGKVTSGTFLLLLIAHCAESAAELPIDIGVYTEDVLLGAATLCFGVVTCRWFLRNSDDEEALHDHAATGRNLPGGFWGFLQYIVVAVEAFVQPFDISGLSQEFHLRASIKALNVALKQHVLTPSGQRFLYSRAGSTPGDGILWS